MDFLTYFCAMSLSKKIKYFAIQVLFVILIFPNIALGAMQSESYVIYENIHHDFDGPVIPAIAANVNGLKATVSWTTNVAADSFVVYSTNASVPIALSQEQGNSLKTNTNHSVTLNRLSPNTTYYFKVKSTRVNGGATLSSAINSFVIGADPDVIVPEPTRGGGGTIIIDKTDKIAPQITNLKSEVLDAKSVRISWTTSEKATSFVEYGKSNAFGSVFGAWTSALDHSVVLLNLEPSTTYSFRALSSDSWGNLGESETLNFSTLADETIIDKPEEPKKEDPAKPIDETVKEPSIVNNITESALAFFKKIFPEVSLNEVTDQQLKNVESLNDLADLIAVPQLSGQPKIEIGADEATISWTTDIDANSQIAYAPNDNYRAGANEPYYQIVGNFEEMVTDHKITLHNLTPDTSYHFQIRSKPRIGPTAVSRDYTFATSLETINIVSFFVQIISNEEVIFKWVTNKESDSTVKFSPYNNNVVVSELQKVVSDNKNTVIHEITVTELQAGVYYDIELSSKDSEGNQAMETMKHFSTSEDDLPPVVAQVKADSTVFLDRSNKTQTIISWVTNEPATSRIYYQEGVHGGVEQLAESSELNNSYSKEHIMVITKFKPGVVYSFRVESIDSGNNTTLSAVHTFMTAKQKESIIQIIIGIFENTFGWVKKLM